MEENSWIPPTAPVTTVDVPVAIPNEHRSKINQLFCWLYSYNSQGTLPSSPLCDISAHVLVQEKHSLCYGYIQLPNWLSSREDPTIIPWIGVLCTLDSEKSGRISLPPQQKPMDVPWGCAVCDRLLWAELVRFAECKAFLRQDCERKHVPSLSLCSFCGFVTHAKLLRC